MTWYKLFYFWRRNFSLLTHSALYHFFPSRIIWIENRWSGELILNQIVLHPVIHISPDSAESHYYYRVCRCRQTDRYIFRARQQRPTSRLARTWGNICLNTQRVTQPVWQIEKMWRTECTSKRKEEPPLWSFFFFFLISAVVFCSSLSVKNTLSPRLPTPPHPQPPGRQNRNSSKEERDGEEKK